MMPLQLIIDVLTKSEREKIYKRIWRRMTAHDGYQPFGYDRQTLQISCPNEVSALEELSEDGQLYRPE